MGKEKKREGERKMGKPGIKNKKRKKWDFFHPFPSSHTYCTVHI